MPCFCTGSTDDDPEDTRASAKQFASDSTLTLFNVRFREDDLDKEEGSQEHLLGKDGKSGPDADPNPSLESEQGSASMFPLGA